METIGISEIIAAQREFFERGITKDISFRVKQLKKLKKQLMAYETELTHALNLDLGKSETEAFVSEISLLYRHLDQMIKKLPKWGKPQRHATPLFLMPSKSKVELTPYGNVLIIAPFNYPLLLTIDPLIGAIAGGNTALVGMSEHTPHTNDLLIAIMEESFTGNYIYFYTSSKEMNQTVLMYAFDKVFFTGSERVGRLILEQTNQFLTPVTLELGGKSPALVTENADIKAAAQRIVWGKFLNAGQTCVAPDYCLVDESVGQELLAEMRHCLIEMYGKSPKQSKDYGRLISREAMNRLTRLLEKDKPYLYYGASYDYVEKYIQPTLLSGTIKDSLASMEEEIFGPILPVLTYSTLREAIEFIHKYGKPLAFYPFSDKKREVDWLIHQIDSGDVTINDTVLHLANEYLPFGGVGSSGFGSYHGKESLRCFTYPKSILTRSTKVNIGLMYPPYTTKKKNVLRAFLTK